jgi:hypothetical protein
MKKVIRLTESDLIRLVKRVISEQSTTPDSIVTLLKSKGFTGKESPKEILIQYMIKQLNSMKNNNDTDFNDVIDFIIETGDTLESVTSQKNMVQTMMGSSPKILCHN